MRSASSTMRSISSWDNRPLSFLIVIFCSLPVLFSTAETLRMPFASISKVTSICGWPRGMGGMPSKLNFPNRLLSLVTPHHRRRGARVRAFFGLLPGHDVEQKVENVRLRDSGRDVVPLQGSPLALLRVHPRPQRELQNEELAGLGEEHRCLRANHAHVLVRLHDFLDPRQRKLVVLKNRRVRGNLLDLLHLLLPENFQLLALRLHGGPSLVSRRRAPRGKQCLSE